MQRKGEGIMLFVSILYFLNQGSKIFTQVPLHNHWSELAARENRELLVERIYRSYFKSIIIKPLRVFMGSTFLEIRISQSAT